MSEYWLISAPGDKTCQQTYDTMNNLTCKQNNLCNNFKFHIPDLKVGTLDQLVGLSDDLGKLDTYVEQITRKVAAYLGEVLEDQRDKLHENLLANNCPGPPQPPDDGVAQQQQAQQNQHSVLTGKISSLSNSRDTTTTTCSACHSGSGGSGTGGGGGGGGGSLHHCSSTEGSERDFDMLLSSPICNCDECAAIGIGMTGSASAASASASALTATTLNADEHHQQLQLQLQLQQQHQLQQQLLQQQQQQQQQHYSTSSTLMCAAANKATSIACAITGNALTASNSSTSSCYLPAGHASTLSFCSTSAPTDSLVGKCGSGSTHSNSSSSHFGARQHGASQHFFSSATFAAAAATTTHHHHHYQSTAATTTTTTTPLSSTFDSFHHNNNTCSHNNNRDGQQQQQQQHAYAHAHPHHHHQHQHQHQHHLHHHQHHHHHHPHQHQRQHQQQQLHEEGGGCGGGGGGGGSVCGGSGGNVETDDGAECGGDQLKNSTSTSDLSDTFDWWFHRHKRNSKKSRSSPVSSCCGSSSQGRSSPDTDLAEPPAFPLSPADLAMYITHFQWDMAKYPIKQSLRNIADIISKQIGQIDADLKTKSNAYNNLKGSLQNLEKKQTGSLLTRNLADLVKKEHFILDSEYLTTLLVIVPKMMANDWLANYEKITDMIVPRSSTMIMQDQDFCLFNVTLFKKVVEEFKLHAREKKFIVRDFVYNEEELAAGKNEITKLITDKKKQFGPLVRWLKVNFSEAFCALVHVKALRVFVESVLRYGLPVNFQAILIEPNKKSVKRLRESLNQLYGHLDGASAAGQTAGADNVDIPGLGFGQSEYYPYVFYKINIDMVEQPKI